MVLSVVKEVFKWEVAEGGVFVDIDFAEVGPRQVVAVFTLELISLQLLKFVDGPFGFVLETLGDVLVVVLLHFGNGGFVALISEHEGSDEGSAVLLAAVQLHLFLQTCADVRLFLGYLQVMRIGV